MACGEDVRLNGLEEQWGGGVSAKKKCKCEGPSLTYKGREGCRHETNWHEDGALETEIHACARDNRQT